MEIRNSIVHHLIKERNTPTSVNCREEELEQTEVVIKLFEDILKMYERKTGKAYGIFQEDEINYPFSGLAARHFENETSNFIKYTKDAMTILKNKIHQQNLATGGYVLFVNYHHDEKQYLLIVMINDTMGRVVTEDLKIVETPHLDLSKLHLGGRIGISDWRDGEDGKYISFIKGRPSGDGISQYFREFLGCAEYVDSKEETSNLVDVVRAYCKERGFDYAKTLKVKQTVHDHCQEKAHEGLPVFLEHLSRLVDEDNPEDFLEFANSEEHKVSDGFEPHSRTLTRLKTYIGHSKGLKISFDADLLNTRIHYKREADELIIQGVPEDLKKDLS